MLAGSAACVEAQRTIQASPPTLHRQSCVREIKLIRSSTRQIRLNPPSARHRIPGKLLYVHQPDGSHLNQMDEV